MKNRPIACEACGSIRIEFNEKQRILQVPLANPVHQRIFVTTCADCLAEIIVESDSSKQVKALKFEQGKKSVASLLKRVNESGYTDTRMERVFGLAPHTLNRWKGGAQVSALALAFARCLTIFPELVQVAETGFDSQKARIISFRESTIALSRHCQDVSRFSSTLDHSGRSYGFVGLMGELPLTVSNTEGQGYGSDFNRPKVLEA
jgi:hypothetical protein